MSTGLSSPARPDEYSCVEFGNTLVGFVAGHRFPEALERTALAMAREHNIEVCQVLWAFNGPMAGVFKNA